MLSNILKATTAPLHTKLEQALFSASIMDGTFTLANYNIVLRVNYLVHSMLEPTIFQLPEQQTQQKIELAKRKKSAVLEADMLASQIDPAHDQHLPVNVPVFANEAEALGALYVLEGATLGGQVIIRRLEKNPAFSILPLAYYNVYADQTGARWKQFLELINQCEDQDCVLRGAQKVYKLYLDVADAIKQA